MISEIQTVVNSIMVRSHSENIFQSYPNSAARLKKASNMLQVFNPGEKIKGQVTRKSILNICATHAKTLRELTGDSDDYLEALGPIIDDLKHIRSAYSAIVAYESGDFV